MRSFSGRAAGLKLSTKLLFGYGMLILLITLALTFLSGNVILQSISRENRNMAEQAFDQAQSYLSHTMGNVENTLGQIVLNKTVSDAMIHVSRPDTYTVAQQIEDMNGVRSYFFELWHSTGMEGIRLYVPAGFLYSNEGQTFFNFDQILDSDWYAELLRNDRPDMWYGGFEPVNGTPVLSALRAYRNPGRLSSNIGVVRIDIQTSEITNILDRSASLNGTVCLLDGGGKVLLSSRELSTGTAEEIFQCVQAPGFKNWENAVIGGKKVLIGAAQISQAKLRLVSLVSADELMRPVYRMQRVIWGLFAVLLPVFLLLAYLFTKIATKRVKLLSGKMKEVGKGELSPVQIPHGRDEVGDLIDAFNGMITQLSQMMEEKYRAGVNLKSMELQALQAQINPHFLYNTLDMIYWMAMESKTPEIADTVIDLARYFKLSLSKGKDIVTLGVELEHVAMYVAIQNRRMDNAIRYSTDVDAELLDCLIPKTTLQPIVENAILHGIMMKPEKSGSLRIAGKTRDGLAVLTVADDGAGVSEERLREVLSGLSGESESGGYGVRNVQERLKIRFGEAYGLSYDSVVGQGTTVKVIFPQEREKK